MKTACYSVPVSRNGVEPAPRWLSHYILTVRVAYFVAYTLDWPQFHASGTSTTRAYSFCAVFLFRFINRNRNRRVQKERLSFERNNFHGNKMAHSLISKRKGKKYEKIIREQNSKKKCGWLSLLTSCFHRLRYLLRSFSSVFERVFMDTSRNGELLRCWQPFFWREKRWERCGTRRGIICCAFCGATLTKVSVQLRQKIVFQTACENKEINENVDAPA